VRRSLEEVLEDIVLVFYIMTGMCSYLYELRNCFKMNYSGYIQDYPKTMPSLVLVASLGLCAIARIIEGRCHH
jgi:hypothetical protein